MLKSDKLKGAIVYYDGSHNDARMCLSIAISAVRHGATVANHTKYGLNDCQTRTHLTRVMLFRVTELLKDDDGKICGAKMKDELTGAEWTTKAKCVINATGPFTDSIRKMDDPSNPEIVCPSAGIHIILPDFYSPANMGLLDPSTSDGRVIFFLPWQGHTIAGKNKAKVIGSQIGDDLCANRNH